ncbi:hypothetical protein IV203_029860 [Nitzschia inconspicua]|uniref:Uncharacterized protein n=1 Tax=Nitzschia inconspicua TaxID=303405 RepID=A0A9K3LRH0_9STRA|nr:hypothetical protein IV203_029860 [Nitzschia inconspicua]
MCHLTVSTRRPVSLDSSQHSPETSLLGTKRPRSAMVTLDNNNNRSRRKQKQTVKFLDKIDTIERSATEQGDVQILWYGHKELEEFKKQARDFILGRSSEKDTETRGYERYNVVTAKKKAMTRKVTLLACSQKGLSSDDVAVIVHKSTRWAVSDAFRTGCQDFCQVYRPELVNACKMMGKRSRRSDETSERSVRRRNAAY